MPNLTPPYCAHCLAAVAFDDAVTNLIMTADEYNFFRRLLPCLVSVRREFLKG